MREASFAMLHQHEVVTMNHLQRLLAECFLNDSRALPTDPLEVVAAIATQTARHLTTLTICDTNDIARCKSTLAAHNPSR